LKYFGVHGSFEGYGSGLYIIEATDLERAKLNLLSTPYCVKGLYAWNSQMKHIAGLPASLQEIKGEWAESLSDTIDNIRNRETDYYVYVGNGVYFVEI